MAEMETFLGELGLFFEPVATAVESKESLARFFAEFGYRLDPPTANAILPSVQSAFGDVFQSVPDPEEAVDLARTLFGALKALSNGNGVQGVVGNTQLFATEIFDYLVFHYLTTRIPPASAILKALGVVTTRRVKPSDPGGRQIEYVRLQLDWSLLGDFFRDNPRWAAEVYGWGVDFDHAKAIDALVLVVQATQLALAEKREMPAGEAAAFLKNAGGKKVVEATLPIVQDDLDHVETDGTPVFSKEAGFKVVPFGDLNQPQKLGLALAPYVMGSATGKEAVTDRLSLEVTVDGRATGGAYVTMTPDGIGVAKGGAVDARFEFGLTYANKDGKPLLLVGDPGATRVEADAILGSAGGSLSGDFYVAGGLSGLRAVVDLSQDGFLGALLSTPLEVEAGNVLAGWRTGRGVYFEGGTSLGVTIPLDLQAGPINLAELGVRLDWAEDVALTLTASGDATVGPLFAYVEDMGLVTSLVPSENGVLGRYDLVFAFKPPTGYAVALEAPAIEGGGYLAVYDHEYRGALALKFQTFGLAAFGILSTQLPGGKKGFSFVASIFGQFTLPLGFGFFLTGVGGILGLNRTTDTDALRTVLFEGRFDNLLFPQDPIANAAKILEDMANVFPASEGQHLFGPVAKIAWGQPVLIEGKLGVVVEVGRNTRLLILGGIASELPTRDAALVSLKVSFFGEIDFSAGTISFDATLATSRVLTWPVSGDAAVRTGWAERLDHVASFGGLHPRYPRPSNLPELRRLSISFGTNNPRVTLSGYAAVTLGSLQFGARADLYAKGPKIPLLGQTAAEGWVEFNALIAFNPFGFDVSLGGGLQLLVDGDVEAGLGFDLRLTGPNTFRINGKVWVTIIGIDVDFSIKHRWGSAQSLPVETADPLAVLRQAVRESARFEPLPARNRIEAVVFATGEEASAAVDPQGGVRFVQRALPLGVAIQKIGEAQIAGSLNRFDLKVLDPGKDTGPAATDARVDFVRGHFWPLSEADKLRSPAFEKHKAGFDVSAEGLLVDAAAAVVEDYAYEVIELEVEDDRDTPARILPHLPLSAEFAARWTYVHHAQVAAPPERFRPRVPLDALIVWERGFVTPSVVEDAAAAATGPAGPAATLDFLKHTLEPAVATLTGMRERVMAGDVGRMQQEVNGVVADYIAVSAL